MRRSDVCFHTSSRGRKYRKKLQKVPSHMIKDVRLDLQKCSARVELLDPGGQGKFLLTNYYVEPFFFVLSK